MSTTLSKTMSDETTQETQPKKGEPVEIPVPSKDQVMTDFEKIVSAPVPGSDEEDDYTSNAEGEA